MENIVPLQKLFTYSAIGVKINLCAKPLNEFGIAVNTETLAVMTTPYVIVFSSKTKDYVVTLVEDNGVIVFKDKHSATQYIDKLMRIFSVKLNVGDIKNENLL